MTSNKKAIKKGKIDKQPPQLEMKAPKVNNIPNPGNPVKSENIVDSALSEKKSGSEKKVYHARDLELAMQQTSIVEKTAQLKQIEAQISSLLFQKENKEIISPKSDENTSRPVQQINVKKSDLLKRPDVEYFKKFNSAIEVLVESLVPPPSDLEDRDRVFKTLEGICHSLFPGSTLWTFGSTANGFALKNADMDLCLVLDSGSTLEATEIIESLGDMLEKESSIKDVKKLPRARIPIVKLRDAACNISCDIGYNNLLAVYNTRLLKAYSMIDDRLKKMAYVVKYWAKRRKINEPYFGSLSSYCYIIMLIYFLQTRDPPILPNLQKINPGSETIQGFNVHFTDNVQFKGQNNSTTAELLFDFFNHFANEFPYVDGVISILHSSCITKESKEWTIEHNTKKDKFWFCVEDPFELTHNLGRLVDKDTLYDIRGEFMRAAKLMHKQSSVEEICKKFK